MNNRATKANHGDTVPVTPCTGERRLHIALFLSSLAGDSIQRAATHLAQAFMARGNRIDLVAARVDQGSARRLPAAVRLVDLHALAARLPWMRRKGRRWILPSARELAQYLRRERPDVLIAEGSYSYLSALAARRLSRVQLAVLLYEQNTLSRTCRHPGGRRVLLPSLARHFYPKADGIVAVSQGVADDLMTFAHVPAERLTVIYNPALDETFPTKANEALDHAWFSPGAPPVILSVARLAVQKDLATLVRAFARVRAQRPCRLLLLGEGRRRGELEMLVQQLGVGEDVSMPGFVVNPFPYMVRSQVFALSSIYEGCPFVLIEALACGCAIVSTDCPSGPAEILDHGAYGQLVRMGDDVAFAAALSGALDAAPDHDALVARAEEFSAPVIADQFLALLLRHAPDGRSGKAAA